MTIAAAPSVAVPFHQPGRLIAQDRAGIDAAIARVLSSGYLIHGPEHAAFEQEFAAYCGLRHCVALANGTDALELSLRALGCGPGDEVIAAPNAGGYSATAIALVGATPVFADIDPDTLNLSPASVAAMLGPKVKAVIVTHLYGFMADVAALQAALRAAGSQAAVVEDCAQAHGAMRDGLRAGAFGDIAAFSFYPTKNLGALGDGGAVLTGRDDLADQLRRLRQYGWTDKYVSAVPYARNSRLDEMQAAILRTRLPRLDGWNARRRAIVEAYASAAGNGLAIVHAGRGNEHVGHLCVARSADRAGVLARLAAAGIGAQIHYPVPDHRQQSVLARPFRAPPLPEAERACAEILSLPCYPELRDDEIEAVIRALRSA